MDEKIEIIAGLENTIQKLKMKHKEEKSEMAKQFQVMKQQYLDMVFFVRCILFLLIINFKIFVSV